MQTLFVVARLLMCSVFVVAGIAKVADSEESRRVLVDFGVPRILARPVGLLLPVVELAVAIALLSAPSAWWGAAASFGLLLLFSIGMSINLLRGLRPVCRCFGQLSTKPIGWSTVVRSLVLTPVSGFLIWKGRRGAGPSVVAWLAGLNVVQRAVAATTVVALVLLILLVRMFFHPLRQQVGLRLRLEVTHPSIEPAAIAPSAAEPPAKQFVGLPVGTPAPRFRLDGLHGGTLTLESLLGHQNATILVFTHPSCHHCQCLMPDLAIWQREHTGDLNIVLVSEGTVEDNLAKTAVYGLRQILLQKENEITEAYRASVPGALIVRPDGMIGSPVAQGADGVRALIAQVLDERSGLAASTSTFQKERRTVDSQVIEDQGAGDIRSTGAGARE